MAGVFKRDGDSKWSFWYFDWKDGKRKRVYRAGYTDKGATVRRARALELEAEKRRDGLIDTAAEKMRDFAHTPMAEHIAAFIAHLRAKGNTPAYIGRVESFITSAVDGCEWTSIDGIDGAAVAGYIQAMKAEGKGRTAINHRLRAVKAFTRWLAVHHRLRRDPLSAVKMLNAKDDARRQRRALTDDELTALIDVADASDRVVIPKPYRAEVLERDDNGKPIVRKGVKVRRKVKRIGKRTLTIPNRGALYLLAASTGFRSGELRSLTPRSFRLDDETPTVAVEAAYSKRRRRDVQPIRPGTLPRPCGPWWRRAARQSESGAACRRTWLR